MSAFNIGDIVRINKDGRSRLIHCIWPHGTGTLDVDHVYEVCAIQGNGNLILRRNGLKIISTWTVENWELVERKVKAGDRVMCRSDLKEFCDYNSEYNHYKLIPGKVYRVSFVNDSGGYMLEGVDRPEGRPQYYYSPKLFVAAAKIKINVV